MRPTCAIAQGAARTADRNAHRVEIADRSGRHYFARRGAE